MPDPTALRPAARFRTLRRALALATPLPWRWKLPPYTTGCRPIRGGKTGKSSQGQYRDIAYTVGLTNDAQDRANADLIVKGVSALPALLDAVEYARDCLHGEIEAGELCECAVCEAIARAS